MPISIFPAAVTSSINASSISAATANTQYRDFKDFAPSVYRVSCIPGVISTVDFYLGQDDHIVRATTAYATGVVDVILPTAADNIRFFTDSGTNTLITVTNLADILTNDFTGTLDTITSTGTYTGTSTSGYGYALVIGGGGSGASRTGDSVYTDTAAGGGAGGMAGKIVALTGSMSVTIGAGGTSVTGNNSGIAGGNSVFAGITATGGAGGQTGDTATTTAGGTSSTGDFNVTGGIGGNWHVNPTASASSPYPFIAFGTIGGGQGTIGGGNNRSERYGNTLGVGGAAGSITTNRNATGKGAGGGGITNNLGSGTGAPGVVYVLRF